jgi:hypothetical protein
MSRIWPACTSLVSTVLRREERLGAVHTVHTKLKEKRVQYLHFAGSRFVSHFVLRTLNQCFSTAGPWHQLYRAASGSPGICHFSFLNIFHE